MKTRKAAVQLRRTQRRCAIYTRKSSEEGLDQAFNSLDAQREACEAYIRSQRHEGWLPLPTLYDDGGISGGTLERPALQQLLADIAAGKVDLVVVYKVDRLTRSLADFAKIVDVFDAHGASFVSVTQQFNTSTSMGRLTLNMLLSFAQFEREVTGERIRDKIAASKRKGMWMGGNVPLGYDVQDRRLVINEAEAETIRHISRTYLELGSVGLLEQRLAEQRICSKLRPQATSARMRGGAMLQRGALYLILQNRLYRGEISHKDAVYPGEHEAIIDQETWDAVQQCLAVNRANEHAGHRAKSPSLLAGLIYDQQGKRLIPTHASKGNKRYRYYISKALTTGSKKSSDDLRIPARELEQLVWGRLSEFLSDCSGLLPYLQAITPDGLKQRDMLNKAADLVASWANHSIAQRRGTIIALVDSILVQPHQIELRLFARNIASGLSPGPMLDLPLPPDQEPIILLSPLRLQRIGYEMRMIVDVPDGRSEPNERLIKLVIEAQQVRQRMLLEGLGIGALAKSRGVGGTYIVRLLRLSYLAPDIIASILDGRQPPAFTANTLQRNSMLPLSWTEQKRQFGFA